jgi:hypothetical protein
MKALIQEKNVIEQRKRAIEIETTNLEKKARKLQEENKQLANKEQKIDVQINEYIRSLGFGKESSLV